jgi:hypothetical protein
VLAWHVADDDGEPVEPSPFVEEVARLLADVPLTRRAIGAVGWAEPPAPGTAPPADGSAARGIARERLRADAAAAPRVAEAPAAPLTHPAVLARLRDRPAWSASSLEAWTGCPVKWFVERLLKPDGLEPDPEQLARGNLAHRVLEHALRRLSAAGALTPDRLPEARAAVRAALEELAGEVTLSVDPARARALHHRLEADLVRYVEAAAASGPRTCPRSSRSRSAGSTSATA